MIEFTCPSCGQGYRVKDELAGKKAQCKKCGEAMTVPSLAADAVVPPAEKRPVAVPPSSAVAKSTNGSAERSSENISGRSEHFSFEISQRPDFALVTVNLEPGQKIFAETSAMASMSPSVTLQSGLKGGLAKSIGRAFGGDSMIINTFTAESEAGEVTFAAGAMGDAAHYKLTGNSLYLQRGAFMLHSDGVDVTGKWQGAKGFFSGEGLVLL